MFFDAPAIAPTKPELGWQVAPEATPAPKKIAVVKFGGSFAVLENGRLNVDYFEKEFFPVIAPILLSEYSKVGLVLGGGNDARQIQAQTKGDAVAKDKAPRERMWTRAETLRRLTQTFGLWPVDRVPHSPEEAKQLAADPYYNLLIASWLKEGQSTDGTTAFLSQELLKVLAESTDPAQILVTVIILSDVDAIYNRDPNRYAKARAIRSSNLSRLVKEKTLSADISTRIPGMKVPMTPEAVARLLEMKEQGNEPNIYFGHDKNIDAVRAALLGEDPTTLTSEKRPISGTVLRPDATQTIYYSKRAQNQKSTVR